MICHQLQRMGVIFLTHLLSPLSGFFFHCYLGDELECMHPSLYRNVARQLNISVAMENMVSDAFIAVATEIFSTGTHIQPYVGGVCDVGATDSMAGRVSFCGQTVLTRHRSEGESLGEKRWVKNNLSVRKCHIPVCVIILQISWHIASKNMQKIKKERAGRRC